MVNGIIIKYVKKLVIVKIRIKIVVVDFFFFFWKDVNNKCIVDWFGKVKGYEVINDNENVWIVYVVLKI